ncbi:MAG: PE family protein [Mycobacterium sp.]
MSYVIADPEMMTAAASDLTGVGSNVSAANMAAAPTFTAVPPTRVSRYTRATRLTTPRWKREDRRGRQRGWSSASAIRAHPRR